MPPKIRAILSLVVITAGALLWLFRGSISLDASPVLFFGLCAALVGALWMFPEMKKDEGA